MVLVASGLAHLGRAGASAYAATKGAVISMTRSWARELAPSVLVNAVAPGPIDTPLLGYEAMDETARAIETANPVGRIGCPEEVAAVVAFLTGPECGFVDRPVLRRRRGRRDALRPRYDLVPPHPLGSRP